MSNALKFIYLAGALIITCSLLSIGFKLFHKMNVVSESISVKTDMTLLNIKKSEMETYEREGIQGYEVANLLKKEFSGVVKEKTGDIYIRVYGINGDFVYVNCEYLDDIRDAASDRYIKPLAEYSGKLIRNQNDCIIGIEFKEGDN